MRLNRKEEKDSGLSEVVHETKLWRVPTEVLWIAVPGVVYRSWSPLTTSRLLSTNRRTGGSHFATIAPSSPNSSSRKYKRGPTPTNSSYQCIASSPVNRADDQSLHQRKDTLDRTSAANTLDTSYTPKCDEEP